MSQLTLTKDIWSIAEREIDKIKPDKVVLLENENAMMPVRKSMTDILKRGQQVMNKILPKGLSQKIVPAKEDVPESIKLLDSYAQRMGFMPMGGVYEKLGSKYVGRSEEITEKGERFYRPFPELKETFFDTPNLIQNLSFRANKTIEKWNEFVSAEAELVDFIAKADTEEGKRQLILDFAKTSSVGSDQLKILSSLYFYYIEGKTSNLNVLGLSEDDVDILKTILVEPDYLETSYDKVMQLLRSSDVKNTKMFNRIKDYHVYKVKSLEASLTDEEFKIINETLREKKAAVPKEMMQTPTVEQSEWFRIIEGEKNNLGDVKLITDRWDPKQKWFKAVNYLR